MATWKKDQRRRNSPRRGPESAADERRRPAPRSSASISSRYGRPIGIRSSHSTYSMSRRAISPRDQPAYRPNARTVPDGFPGGSPAAPNPSRARIVVGSYPPPDAERPDVQSEETESGS